jgi:type II secretory pathway pseudopilin PulG
MNKLSLLIGFLFLFLFNSCDESNSLKEEELALRERELALKEQELALKESSANTEFDNEASTSSTANKTAKQYQTKATSISRQKSESELRAELYNTEKGNPKNYLSVDYDLTYKVLTGEDKISGQIYNYASITTFKDIKIKVSYFSDTDTEITSKIYVVYDYVHPGGSTPFVIKTYSPEGTKKINVKINNAIPD